MTVPDEISIRPSRLRSGVLLLAALVFVGFGILFVVTERGRVVGWLTILFFGAGIPLFARQLLDSRPRLVIDEQGILDRTLKVGVIPWTEITGARLETITGNTFVCLEVRDPAIFTRQFGAVRRALTSGNRALGFADLNLNLSGLPVRGEEVLALIRRRCASRTSGNR